MDTPELPPQPTPDEPPSPESQPPESAQPQSQVPAAQAPNTMMTPPPPSYDPNAPFGYQTQGQYGYFAPQPQPISTTSRPFSEIWKIVWTQPDVTAYRDVLRESNTTLNRSITWVASVWGVALVVAFIVAALFGVNNYNTLQNESFSQSTDTQASGGGLICGLIICVPILLLIGIAFYLLFNIGIPHVVAMVMGGKGRYEHTAFLYSAIYAPSVLMGSLSNLVPRLLVLQCIVGLMLLVMWIYSFVMQVIAIKAAHDIGWFQSAVAALAPLLLIVGFVGCCFLLALAGSVNS